METHKAPTLTLRAGLAVLAVAAAAAIWGATALAAGGSSPTPGSAGSGFGGIPAPRLVASTPERPAAPSRHDCPGHAGSGGGGSGSSSTSDAV